MPDGLKMFQRSPLKKGVEETLRLVMFVTKFVKDTLLVLLTGEESLEQKVLHNSSPSGGEDGLSLQILTLTAKADTCQDKENKMAKSTFSGPVVSNNGFIQAGSNNIVDITAETTLTFNDYAVVSSKSMTQMVQHYHQ